MSSYLKLGQGYDEGTQDEKPNTCIKDFKERLSPVDKRKVRAFQTYQKNEITTKVKAGLEVGLDNEYVKAGFSNKLNEYYVSNSTTKAVLSIVVYFESYNKVLDRTGGIGSDPDDADLEFYCSTPSRQFDTFEGFVGYCGDRYLRAQNLGGFAMVSVDVSSLNREERIDLESKLKVGVNAGFFKGVELDGSFSYFASATSNIQSLEYDVVAYGVQAPDPGLLTNGKLTADKWSAYMKQIRDSYTGAYQKWLDNPNSSTINNPDLGIPIEQSFQEYTPDDLEACSLDGDGFRLGLKQLSCYQDFWKFDNWAYSPTVFSDLQRSIARMQWALDNSNQVVWQNPVSEHQASYQDVIDQYDRCQNSRRASREQCESARDGGQVKELCDLCQHAPGCRDEELLDAVNKAPEAPIRPADPKPRPQVPAGPTAYYEPTFHSLSQNKTSSLEDLQSYVCVWSGFSGRFDGGGEGVKVFINGLKQWAMETWSGNNKYVRSYAVCMARDNFSGAASNDWQTDRVDQWDTTGFTEHNPSYDADTVFALSGISGRLEGGGESAVLETRADATLTSLKMNTQQRWLRTWTNGFGLEDPFNNTVKFVAGDFTVDTRTTNALRYETQLTPSDSTFCYLKEVLGDFDGGAERVSVIERDGNWILTASSIRSVFNPARGAKKVKATAQCIYLNQST